MESLKYILGGLLILLLSKRGMTVPAGNADAGLSFLGRDDLNRGIRNNNPGNIEQSANQWQGKISNPTDLRFEQFTNMYYGIRALVRNLRTYYFRDNLRNIRDIVYKWCPPSDCDTESYVLFVASQMNTFQGRTLNWNVGDIYPLVKAIIKKENAPDHTLIPDALIYRAVSENL